MRPNDACLHDKREIDLCRWCFRSLGYTYQHEAAHPPYSSGDYTCFVCKEPLTDEDN